MPKNDSYAGQLIDEIKRLKDRCKKLSLLNDELEEQIILMKCCENCYYRDYIEEDDEYGCGLYWSGNPNTDECVYDRSCRDRTNAVDRWKLKE